MLSFAIIIPTIALIFPFIGCRLQNHHIVNGVLFRVGDNDSVLQKPRCSDFFRAHFHIVANGRDIANQPFEPLVRGAHADDNGHGCKTVQFAALQEFLHNGGGAGGIFVLHSPVGFVDNHIKPVALLLGGILQGLPNGICATVPVAYQSTGFAQLLCIQKINLAIV